MATDIYGNEVYYTANKIVSAHKMILTVEGQTATTVGALVQNVAIQYSQPVQIIREVGSTNYYYFSQLPQGSVSFGRLVAVDKTILDVLPRALNGTTQNIWKVPDEGETSPQVILRSTEYNLKYIMNQCIVENLGINTDINAMFVQEQVVIRFGSLMIES